MLLVVEVFVLFCVLFSDAKKYQNEHSLSPANRKNEDCPHGVYYRQGCEVCYCLETPASDTPMQFCESHYTTDDCGYWARKIHCDEHFLDYNYNKKCEGSCECQRDPDALKTITTCEYLPCHNKILEEYKILQTDDFKIYNKTWWEKPQKAKDEVFHVAVAPSELPGWLSPTPPFINKTSTWMTFPPTRKTTRRKRTRATQTKRPTKTHKKRQTSTTRKTISTTTKPKITTHEKTTMTLKLTMPTDTKTTKAATSTPRITDLDSTTHSGIETTIPGTTVSVTTSEPTTSPTKKPDPSTTIPGTTVSVTSLEPTTSSTKKPDPSTTIAGTTVSVTSSEPTTSSTKKPDSSTTIAGTTVSVTTSEPTTSSTKKPDPSTTIAGTTVSVTTSEPTIRSTKDGESTTEEECDDEPTTEEECEDDLDNGRNVNEKIIPDHEVSPANRKNEVCPHGVYYRQGCEVCYCLETPSSDTPKQFCESFYTDEDCGYWARKIHCNETLLEYNYNKKCEGSCECQKDPDDLKTITTCSYLPCHNKILEQYGVLQTEDFKDKEMMHFKF